MDDAEAVRQCRAGQAILLGYRALTAAPSPPLERRRGWAKAATVLGAAHIVLVVTVVLLNLDRLSRVVEVLRAVSDVK